MGPPNQRHPIELSSESLTSAQRVLARSRAAGYNPYNFAVALRAFAWAARQGAEDLIKDVLENTTFAAEELNRLLCGVAALGSSYAASRLIAKAANIDDHREATGVNDRQTPFQVARIFGSIDTAMLQRWANVRARDAMEQTALHKAAGGPGHEQYRIEVIELVPTNTYIFF
ncbi:hypothetical protein N7G274_010650 [Stereocaulon virgatum]|uniref:Uncharacterized protein n=1 Tax=Stereocaulon virgatum TaxID=373712 RepID=A0ABR3ZU60_9LECA